MSEAAKGKTLSEETKKKIGEAKKGERHPLYGKHHTEDVKRKMSEAHKGKNAGEKHYLYGKHISTETKRKISDSSKDRIWINNGVVNKFVKINSEIPEGFVRGMLKRKNDK